VRPSDTVARLAGDEFTVLIEDSGDASHIDSLIERIQHAIAHPVMIGDTQMSTNASIGVLRGNGTYQSASDMVRDADIAMYQAKMMGKARVVKFDASMHVRALERLQLENELRRAIDDNQLRVFYQPIVALADASIAGVEALVRWQHPTRGLLTPADFLTVAEESGLIVPLSWWTLREACAQMHAWQGTIPGAKELWISVNLSSRQLAQPDMLIQLQRVLRETGLAPQRLKLEITEYTLLEYGDATLRTLDALRELGIQLCIDDFGTGYSSLSYLQRFPVDVLKIDRSFINQLGEDQRRSEIVHTILGLARTLGLQVVAEGTETIQQVSELQRQHCDFGQGWLFSRAVDAAAAATFIQSAPSFDLPGSDANQGMAPEPDAHAA
jgi:EAL domain-containing protein (putative c-di-GMP-specific phosphodiesterase class I)